jgi:YEATS domain-containing protein 4
VQASHQWICFVRGINNQDISHFISKVVFTLHPSFKNNIRVVTSPPFEVREIGWG